MPEAIVDANVPLRLLTAEPPELARRARDIVARAAERDVDLVMSPMIVAEIVYVLTRVYGWPRADVVDRLLDLVTAELFVIQDQSAVEQALIWHRDRSSLDFPDAYVAAVALARGHGRVVSFDADLARLPGLTAITDAEQI